MSDTPRPTRTRLIVNWTILPASVVGLAGAVQLLSTMVTLVLVPALLGIAQDLGRALLPGRPSSDA